MITPKDAAREVLRRRRARATLVDYSQAITIPGAPVSDDPDEWLFHPIESAVAQHHIVTMQAIERCVRTDYGRLMIFEPPGSAKSTYASVVGTTWAMGAFPGLRVLMTSYAATPIIRHSKRARQIVSSPEYVSIWEKPTMIVDGSKAADEWELTNGSGLFAAGLMGGITSSRCDLGIIDDPVAGREEADSPTIRIKTRAAYDDDFLTRLKPKASIILIQTRWNPKDLAGGILPEDYDGRSGPVECRDGQVWTVLNIPAQCEHLDDPVGREIGEYLWPEWFTDRHWAIFKRNARTWSALYQQRPVPDSGIYFKREDFQRYNVGQQPECLNKYMASDFAVTEEDQNIQDHDPDYTEHGVIGVDSVHHIWVLDWYYDKVESDVGVAEAVAMAKLHGPDFWFGEGGVIEKAIGPLIRMAMRLADVWVVRHILPVIGKTGGNKVARCKAFMGRVSARTVHVPNTEWGDRLIEALCAYPAGHDDAFDVCGLFGRGLDMITSASPPPQEPKKKSWKDELLDMTGHGRRNPATA
jgi:hypothetical protein